MTTSDTRHRVSGVDPEARTGTCSQCGPVRVVRKRNARAGYWVCRNRHLASKRAWIAANPGKVAEHARRHEIKSRYGLSEAAYLAMLAAQEGVCAICGEPPREGENRLGVDHDHACCPGQRTCGGCVRGLLCNRCNTGLGWFREAPPLFERAAAYLRTPPSRAAAAGSGNAAAAP